MVLTDEIFQPTAMVGSSITMQLHTPHFPPPPPPRVPGSGAAPVSGGACKRIIAGYKQQPVASADYNRGKTQVGSFLSLQQRPLFYLPSGGKSQLHSRGDWRPLFGSFIVPWTHRSSRVALPRPSARPSLESPGLHPMKFD